MKNKPLVSVVMPSYNHAAYIHQAIESVLEQTYPNLELLITDDGSSDDTINVIRRFNDPRIKLHIFEQNKGACLATNDGIERAKGEFICIINSDDFWCQDKIEQQLKIFEEKPYLAAVFAYANFVDEAGVSFQQANKPSYANIFIQENRDRGEWLRKFFFDGNCLCHPTIMIKRECYQMLGMYDNRLRQLPDFDMWVRLLSKYDIYILAKELINFRVFADGSNASSPTLENDIRVINEHYFISKNIFNTIAIDDFKQGFADFLVNSKFSTPEEFEIEKTLLYFLPTLSPDLDKVHRMIGMQRLYELLSQSVAASILENNYYYSDRVFQKMMAETYTFRKNIPNNILQDIGTRRLIKELLSRRKHYPFKKIINKLLSRQI
jgi:glycosyltransferase involved in cell wall biosynthesis